MSEGPHREEEAEDLLTSGPERSGSHRSPWIWRIAGLLAVGVLAVTAGPGLLSSPDPAPPQPARSPGPAGPSGPADSGDLELGTNEPHNNPLLAWTSRGPDLDTSFVTAALARMRAEGRHVDHVLWAGSLDGHDHVLVVSYLMAPVQRASDDREIGVLRVDRTSQLAHADSVTIGYVGQPEDLVGTAFRGDDKHTRLLVLSYPEPRRLQISPAVDYHPSGTVTRRWRDATVDDGVLVTDLGRAVDPTVVVRPDGLNTQTEPALVEVQGLPGPPGAAQLAIAGVRSPSYAGPAIGVLANTLGGAVRPYTNLRRADVRVVWSAQIAVGRKPSGKPAHVRTALLVVRRHDGATFQVFVYASPGDRLGESTAYPVRWSIADRLPYAINVEHNVLLISPGGAGSATLRPMAGGVVRARLDRHGLASVHVNSLDGADIVLRDPSGRTVLRATLVNSIRADIFGIGL